MEIHPQSQEYSEIFPAKQPADEEEAAEMMDKLYYEGKILAVGPKESLQKLQDDLHQRGYRKVK